MDPKCGCQGGLWRTPSLWTKIGDGRLAKCLKGSLCKWRGPENLDTYEGKSRGWFFKFSSSRKEGRAPTANLPLDTGWKLLLGWVDGCFCDLVVSRRDACVDGWWLVERNARVAMEPHHKVNMITPNDFHSKRNLSHPMWTLLQPEPTNQPSSTPIVFHNDSPRDLRVGIKNRPNIPEIEPLALIIMDWIAHWRVVEIPIQDVLL